MRYLVAACLFGLVSSYAGSARLSRLTALDDSKPLNALEMRYSYSIERAIDEFEFYSLLADTLQCAGNLASALVENDILLCKLTGRHRYAGTFPTGDEPPYEVAVFKRKFEDFNGWLFNYTALPRALSAITDEDPRGLMALVGLGTRQRRIASRRLARYLATQDVDMSSQNMPSKTSKPSTTSTIPSGTARATASKDSNRVRKWAEKARRGSSARRDVASPQRRATSDDEENVAITIAYIARQVFGEVLDRLERNSNYGLEPDEDAIPSNLLSRTSNVTRYPGIFEGDADVTIREIDFYAVRQLLYPDKTDDDEDEDTGSSSSRKSSGGGSGGEGDFTSLLKRGRRSLGICLVITALAAILS